MHLVPQWRALIRRAWSIRLILIAGLLSGLSLASPDLLGIPRGLFAGLSALVTAAAFAARLIAQRME
ncbi:hypothetical protein M2324_000418 [Rhodovulum sulfidophilum]|uniref:DUF7940 domain-containing protein n=1 Tax=Rhodovulum sulfidophilum TaxID=35806 RepID=UPI0005AAB815|nr:hypothetical protein [Rhodovulum sulfidophilum]ANB34735.1 hypothetical protein A6W98_12095 [Rhodovulum sulfidophilum DSM 1374]ANB38557.1 hypothetical protein A6024_11960 [Rhodovulum sulfidophilum]MCW2302036.1 hypothetical protein [Rhodovulum sulfidophilum]